MFDAVAPRYDRVNRVMTFRLDRRWRRSAVRSLGPAAGARTPDLAIGHQGDLCIEPRRHGLRPVVGRPQLRDAGADRSGAPRVQADIARLPFRTAPSTGSRAASRCATSSTSTPSSSSWHGSCARAGASPSSRWRAPQPGAAVGPLASTSARSCPRSAACSSDAAAYRYLPRSVAYLRRRRTMVAALRASRVCRRPRRTAVAAASPNSSPARGRRDARRSRRST